MAQGEYNVVFRGALTGDKPEDEVKAELTTMFKASPERIEALFSGKPIVLKRNVDASTATKFRAAFQRAGAICELVPASDDEDAAPAGHSDTPERPAEQEAAKAQHDESTASAPTGASEATEQTADSIAVSGDPNRTIVNMAVPDDLSHLTIDDSDRPHQPHEDVPPPQVDLSNLSLAEDETPLSGQRPKEPEREFDTSGMSVEPPPEPPQRHAEPED